MTTRGATTPSMTAADPGQNAWSARRSRRARYLRLAGGVAVFLLIDAGAYAAGQAMHSHHSTRATTCPLQTSSVQSGRAAVTYRDDTNDPRMSEAIRAAVAAWDTAPTHVMLEPTHTAAALTFRAAATPTPLPACRSAAARSVVVTLGTTRWGTGPGQPAVRQPEALIAKVIGHALGLRPGGKCPALMAAKACRNRDPGPDPAEVATVDRLYRAAG